MVRIHCLSIEFKQIDVHNSELSPVSQILSVNSVKDIFSTFRSIFEEKVSCIPGFQITIQLRNGAKPVQRNVTFHMH